jgi:integrase
MAQTRVKTKIPGIRYREHDVRKHGLLYDRYFFIRYRVDGKEKEEGLGWSSEGWTIAKAADTLAELKMNARTGTGEKTLNDKREAAEAVKKSEEIERKRIETENVAADRAYVDRIRLESETVFDTIFTRYCESKSDKKSLRDERTLVRLWVQPVIGSKRLIEITSFDIERLKRDMQKAGRAPRSVQYTFAIIRQVFNYAKQHNLFDGESPTKGVKLLKVDNRRIRFLSSEEANHLLAELKKNSMTSYRISLLSLFSGLRFGEIAGLCWQHIDMENRQIVILDPKNAKTRFSFMADAVCRMFSEMTPGKPNDLVFATKDNRAMKQVSDSFMAAVNRLKLNDGIEDRRLKVVFHSLRHSCGSQLAMSGADLSTIQAVLGHKTLAMTERYSHLSNQHIKKAINRLEDAMNLAGSKVIPLKGLAS